MVKVLFLPQILENVEDIHLALKESSLPSPDESNPPTKLIEATRYFHPQCAIQESDMKNLIDFDIQIGNGVTTGTIRFRERKKIIRKGATWIVFPDDTDFENLNTILDFCRNVKKGH